MCSSDLHPCSMTSMTRKIMEKPMMERMKRDADLRICTNPVRRKRRVATGTTGIHKRLSPMVNTVVLWKKEKIPRQRAIRAKQRQAARFPGFCASALSEFLTILFLQ